MLVYLKFLSMFRYVLKYRSMCMWQLRTMIVVARGSFKLGLKLHAHWLIDGLTDWMTDRLTDSTYSIAARSISQAIRTANMCTADVCVCVEISMFSIDYACIFSIDTTWDRRPAKRESLTAQWSLRHTTSRADSETGRERQRGRQAGRGIDEETEKQ